MMHVMHLIESLEFGGAEKVLVHLANKMSANYQVSVCLTKRRGELVDELDDRIKVHFLDTGEGNSLSLPKMLRALLTSEKVDILHSHDWGVYLEAALVSRQLASLKLIHTVHGHNMHVAVGIKAQLKKKVRHLLERFASRYTDRIVPVSESIQQYIVNDLHIPSHRVSVIHNGISPLNIARHKAGQTIQLIAVGRLAKVKNFAMLLNALALVAEKNNDWHFTLAGDGPLMAELQALVNQLQITSMVTFSGFVRDVPALLSKQDVFLCSSDYEGVSIAILEAMSIGLPVIATRIGGVPETVIDQQTGLLVEVNNPQDMAAAILRVLEAPALRESLGDAAKGYFESHFHEAVVLQKYNLLYQGKLV